MSLACKCCALAYMSLAVGDTYWRCGDILLHICHSLWVTHTGVMMVIRSYMYVTFLRCYTLKTWQNARARIPGVTRTRGLVLCSCMCITRRG